MPPPLSPPLSPPLFRQPAYNSYCDLRSDDIGDEYANECCYSRSIDIGNGFRNGDESCINYIVEEECCLE